MAVQFAIRRDVARSGKRCVRWCLRFRRFARRSALERVVAQSLDSGSGYDGSSWDRRICTSLMGIRGKTMPTHIRYRGSCSFLAVLWRFELNGKHSWVCLFWCGSCLLDQSFRNLPRVFPRFDLGTDFRAILVQIVIRESRFVRSTQRSEPRLYSAVRRHGQTTLDR